ncbi:MAG: hypothetical protein IKD36_00350 [Clostridia bacterium]|nr:hypothetical protein [Clostridia bacterium]
MEEIKNVIVEQKDIYDIINAFNSYFTAKQAIFEKTETLVAEEEARYREWSDARLKSEDFANYPPFQRQTFQDKRTSASLTVEVEYVDGSTISGKSVDEFIKSVANLGFEKMQSIAIYMDITYQAEYKADDYSSNPQNRVSQNVYVKFREDSVYYSVSGENCPSDVDDLKRIILDKFNSLEPRLSKLITNRKTIKYFATLNISFILSAILVGALGILGSKYLTVIDWETYKYLLAPAYLIVSFVLNSFIPSATLSRLYSLIIPKQREEYSSYDKAYHKVDNIKDFVAYPEIQIGANAKRAGVRTTIKKHIAKSKLKNLIAFVIGAAIVTAVVFMI